MQIGTQEKPLATQRTSDYVLVAASLLFIGAYPKVLDFLLVWNPKIQDVDMRQVCKGDGTCAWNAKYSETKDMMPQRPPTAVQNRNFHQNHVQKLSPR